MSVVVWVSSHFTQSLPKMMSPSRSTDRFTGHDIFAAAATAAATTGVDVNIVWRANRLGNSSPWLWRSRWWCCGCGRVATCFVASPGSNDATACCLTHVTTQQSVMRVLHRNMLLMLLLLLMLALANLLLTVTSGMWISDDAKGDWETLFKRQIDFCTFHKFHNSL